MIPTFVLTFVYENSTFSSGTLIITLATANSVYSSRVHCIDAHYNGVHSNDANASDAHSNEAQSSDVYSTNAQANCVRSNVCNPVETVCILMQNCKC